MTALSPGASPPPVEIAMRMSGFAPDQSQYFSRLGVASECLLGENEAAVDGHLEQPARGLDEANLGVGKGLFQLSCQTGGSGLIVLDDAVLDRDEHGAIPSEFPG